jgi:Transposase IS116/IS110/IS902 family
VAPVPASSGKTKRYRLSRGGDRQANHALHRIALVRMSHDPATIDYVHRQTEAGHSKKEILRKLKRAISRARHSSPDRAAVRSPCSGSARSPLCRRSRGETETWPQATRSFRRPGRSYWGPAGCDSAAKRELKVLEPTGACYASGALTGPRGLVRAL